MSVSMTFDTCPHHTSSFLSQEGIFCKLCEAFRQLAALSHRPHSMLSAAIEKLSKWTIRSSSVDGLPDEILIEIFQHYLEMGDRTYPVDRPSSVTAFCHIDSSPVLLSHVCQAWRQLIRTTPTLWSSIAIHNPHRKHIPLVELWLKLAASCPLSISIRHDSEDDSKKRTAVDAILPLLIYRCGLWKSIDFEFWDIPIKVNIPSDSLLTLEHASINMEDAPSDLCSSVWSLIHSSPRLSSVKWLNGFNSFDTAPWERLRCIDFMFMVPIDDLLQSLHCCQNLEVLLLKAGINVSGRSSSTPSEPIRLPALRELTLGNIQDSFQALATIIRTPLLTTLNLFRMDTKDLSDFKVFMGNSKCAIKSFHLVSCYITPTELLEWLTTPGLSSITNANIFIKASHINLHPRLNLGSKQTYLEAVIEEVKGSI